MTAAARYRAACAALGLPVWRPGMLAILAPGAPSARIVGHGIDDMDALDRSGAVPDFADPATLGCLLAVVREVWKWPTLSTSWSFVPLRPGVDWFVTRIHADAYGETEADALIAALEAAAARRGGQP